MTFATSTKVLHAFMGEICIERRGVKSCHVCH